MADVHYSYDDVPTVEDFANCEKFIRGLMGPFGSGKSSGCVIQLVELAEKQRKLDGKRRSRFAVIRNTYRQLEDTTMRTVFDWLPPDKFGKRYVADHRYVIDRLDPELEIELIFRALDRVEHVSNLLSLELTGAWVNEAREVPLAVINALKGRVGRFPAVKDGGCVQPCIFMDTNPPDDESWWYDMFEENPTDGVQVFKQPSGRGQDAENTKYLPESYYENLMEGSDPDFIQVYVDGQYGYVREGKPIYPEYVDEIHCQDFHVKVRPGDTIYRGWDFGLTPSCVFSRLTPNGRWEVIDELVSEDLDIDVFSDQVLLHCSQHYKGAKFEDDGDPAGETRSETDSKTCFEILRGKGVMVQGQGQNLTVRLGSVRKPLNTLLAGKPQFVIHPRCKVLRKGFRGRYQYKKMKIAGAQERFHDKPDKNEYSHPHDALQYTAVRLFGDALKSRTSKRQAVRLRRAGGSVA